MWSKYPDSKPEKSGYYYTYYYNNLKEDHFFKAIYYNINRDKWFGWRSGLEPFVEKYIESTHDNYYCTCLEKAEQLNKEEKE